MNHVNLFHIHQRLASSLLFVLGCGNSSTLLYFYERPETSQSAALQGPSQLKVIFSFMQWWGFKVGCGFDGTTLS